MKKEKMSEFSSSYLEELIQNPQNILEIELIDILKIFHEAKVIFEKENLLLEFNDLDPSDEIIVIGDLHGNLESFAKIIEIINKHEPKFVVSLGDIVDRGPCQLECLITMLSLKILYPKECFIIRGNHETLEMNKAYGFYKYFIKKYKNPNSFDELLSV